MLGLFSWLGSIGSWFKRTDPLVQAGELALAEAERLWSLDVIDPPKGATGERACRSLRVITDIVRDAGWTWEVPYRGNGQCEWCGMFAAACWRKAGLDPIWLATFWASTLRMHKWFRYQDWNGQSAGQRPVSGRRMAINVAAGMTTFVDGTQPRAGDIVVVGDGQPSAGDHITLLAKYDALNGVYSTISGNGGGLGPDGKRREGIVKKDFRATGPGYRVLWVYRPGVSDLVRS